MRQQDPVTLGRRAYRGDFTDADLQVLLDFYRQGRANRDASTAASTWRSAACWRVPSSCSAWSATRTRVAPGAAYRLGDLELASRLSFFLWSSIPDDELLRVAARKRLKDPAVLEQQVRRMLADPKADALVANFAGQWLHLRNLKGKVPNSFQFPDFDDDLRRAMIEETELFFRSVMPRGSQRPRPDDRRLHVPQRAARPALRHSRRSTAASSGASP